MKVLLKQELTMVSVSTVGRLIRTQTDRGIVIVLDKRLSTKQYGRLFMESLPSPKVSQGLLSNLPEQAAKWLSA